MIIVTKRERNKPQERQAVHNTVAHPPWHPPSPPAVTGSPQPAPPPAYVPSVMLCGTE